MPHTPPGKTHGEGSLPLETRLTSPACAHRLRPGPQVAAGPGSRKSSPRCRPHGTLGKGLAQQGRVGGREAGAGQGGHHRHAITHTELQEPPEPAATGPLTWGTGLADPETQQMPAKQSSARLGNVEAHVTPEDEA